MKIEIDEKELYFLLVSAVAAEYEDGGHEDDIASIKRLVALYEAKSSKSFGFENRAWWSFKKDYCD
jgi:hypothetical protein